MELNISPFVAHSNQRHFYAFLFDFCKNLNWFAAELNLNIIKCSWNFDKMRWENNFFNFGGS